MPVAGAALWTGAREMPGWKAHHGHGESGCCSAAFRERPFLKRVLKESGNLPDMFFRKETPGMQDLKSEDSQ